MNRIILFLAIALLQVGCAANVTTKPYGAAPSHVDSTVKLGAGKQPNILAPGTRVELTDPAFPEKVKADVGQQYWSALGMECYRVKLYVKESTSEPAVICRDGSEAWSLAPRIWANSVSGQK